jgi:YggT family protein
MAIARSNLARTLVQTKKFLTKINIIFVSSRYAIVLKPMTTASIFSLILSLLFGLMTILFLFRIVLTWYPQAELNRFPFSLIALPTEPFLNPSRKIIPPLGGVDITPVVWVGIFTLLREILLGQQGLITMAMKING